LRSKLKPHQLKRKDSVEEEEAKEKEEKAVLQDKEEREDPEDSEERRNGLHSQSWVDWLRQARSRVLKLSSNSVFQSRVIVISNPRILNCRLLP
jgi:hypothetical protein